MDPRVWNTAYITGIEGIPWKCHHKLVDDQFSIGREIDESGKLNIVWPTQVAGNLCLSTTSLRVSDTVYSLPAEIARGTLSRLKSQTADWQRVGSEIARWLFSTRRAGSPSPAARLDSQAGRGRGVGFGPKGN